MMTNKAHNLSVTLFSLRAEAAPLIRLAFDHQLDVCLLSPVMCTYNRARVCECYEERGVRGGR